MIIQGRLVNLTFIHLLGGYIYTVMNFSYQQLLRLELPTPGGVGPLAQATQMLSWSTLEELEELITVPKEDQRK